MTHKLWLSVAMLAVLVSTSGCYESSKSIISEADAITPFTPGNYCKYDLNIQATAFDMTKCEQVTLSLTGKTYTLRNESGTEVYKVRIDKQVQTVAISTNVAEACADNDGVMECFIGQVSIKAANNAIWLAYACPPELEDEDANCPINSLAEARATLAKSEHVELMRLYQQKM